MIEAIYVLASMFYRDVVDQVNAAVDETPNPDPLPWKKEEETEP